MKAGVPLAGERGPVSGIDFAEISAILQGSLDHESDPKTRDAIRGWLIAIRDHFPSIYAQFFKGDVFLRILAGPVTGRDIKLRRLALSHLGKVA